MKAVVCTGYGPPEVLQIREVEKPTPKANQVLVRIHATGVTASDCIVRAAKAPILMQIVLRLWLGLTRPRKIMGSVLSGEIESVGKDVKRFRAGDHVYAFTGMRLGTYAEYTCLSETSGMISAMALKPVNVTHEEAAAVPYGVILAMHFLKRGNIQSGQKVLIYGASGAIGTAAVQLAKYFGAEVAGVCSTTNLELVKSLGAIRVIDYTKEDSIGSGELYDLVFDAVGRRKTSKLKLHCQSALTQNGKYISVDDGMPKLQKDVLVLLKELIEAGDFKPVIDRCYPLEEIVEAHRYVDHRHKKGNVAITVSH